MKNEYRYSQAQIEAQRATERARNAEKRPGRQGKGQVSKRRERGRDWERERERERERDREGEREREHLIQGFVPDSSLGVVKPRSSLGKSNHQNTPLRARPRARPDQTLV